MEVGSLIVKLKLDIAGFKLQLEKVRQLATATTSGKAVEFNLLPRAQKENIMQLELQYAAVTDEIENFKNKILEAKGVLQGSTKRTGEFVDIDNKGIRDKILDWRHCIVILEEEAQKLKQKYKEAFIIDENQMNAPEKLNLSISKLLDKVSKFAKTFKYMFGKMISRKIINNIYKYISESVNALVAFSKLNGNSSYNNTLSNYVTLFKKIAAYVALIGVKLLLFVEPLFNMFSTLIQGLLNAFTRNSDTIINKDFWYDYANGVKETNKLVKQLISGFDELNIAEGNSALSAFISNPNGINTSISPIETYEEYIAETIQNVTEAMSKSTWVEGETTWGNARNSRDLSPQEVHDEAGNTYYLDINGEVIIGAVKRFVDETNKFLGPD